MTYTPPLKEQLFTIGAVLGAETEDAAAILEASGQLAAETLAPLNRVGDREHSRLVDGKVVTPTGFKAAYRSYIEGGWNGLAAAEEFGGQNLSRLIAMAVQEQWQSSNMGFALCSLLTQGAIVLLTAHGSAEQKSTYLPKLISGEWTGTMNLTEPQAGSDVGAVRTRAVAQQDGSYKISGQKIFISYGDHDLTDNIIHLVLARIEGSPEGTKGLSLFVVPKFLADGSANDLACVSLEHKLGIHASPTAVMSYGDKGGATGWLVGEPNSGIQGMFTMMNEARLGVGVQGIAIADRAFQQAKLYAADRKQGGQPIIAYPDVRRMLLTMESQIAAARMIAYRAAHAGDMGDHAQVDLLTPIVKSYGTDLANEVTSLNIQVHGGMGVIEETGAAQHYRDARVLAIYEGTNGIQAGDLVFRKILRDQAQNAQKIVDEISETIALLHKTPGDDAHTLSHALGASLGDLAAATDFLLTEKDKDRLAAGATPYLRLFALTLGGAMHAKSLLAANKALAAGEDPAFMESRLLLARFYADNLLPQTAGLAAMAVAGSAAILSYRG